MISVKHERSKSKLTNMKHVCLKNIFFNYPNFQQSVCILRILLRFCLFDINRAQTSFSLKFKPISI